MKGPWHRSRERSVSVPGTKRVPRPVISGHVPSAPRFVSRPTAGVACADARCRPPDFYVGLSPGTGGSLMQRHAEPSQVAKCHTPGMETAAQGTEQAQGLPRRPSAGRNGVDRTCGMPQSAGPARAASHVARQNGRGQDRRPGAMLAQKNARPEESLPRRTAQKNRARPQGRAPSKARLMSLAAWHAPKQGGHGSAPGPRSRYCREPCGIGLAANLFPAGRTPAARTVPPRPEPPSSSRGSGRRGSARHGDRRPPRDGTARS